MAARRTRSTLPPNIPAKVFWSFVVYDNQTRSMLQTDEQFPSIGSEEGLSKQPRYVRGCVVRSDRARRP